MLDQQHRKVRRDSLDQLGDALALGRRQSRERLIEQQDARSACECQAHVEQALPAVRQQTRLRLFNTRQAEKADELAGPVRHPLDCMRVGPAVSMRRVARLHGEAKILLDRKACKEIRDLERARETGRDDALGAKPRDRDSAQHHAAAVGHEQSRDQIEDARLAGAVRADQRVQRAIAHHDARIDDRLDAAERLRQIVRCEDDIATAVLRLQKCRQRHALLDRARRHRGRLDDFRPHRLSQSLPNANQPRRREHDEGDEQKAEIQQPIRRPDRQILAKQNVEERAERRPQ